MDVQFITSIAMITPDPSVSRRLYVDALGLALTAEADGYLHSEDIDGCKSFRLWPTAPRRTHRTVGTDRRSTTVQRRCHHRHLLRPLHALAARRTVPRKRSATAAVAE